MISDLKNLDDAEAGRACSVDITMPNGPIEEQFLEQLYNVLEQERGRCTVFLNMDVDGTRVRLHADSLGIAGSRSLQRELENKGCVVEWSL
jgi:hypothetical protein